MTMMKKLLASAVASALMVSGAQAEISDNAVRIGYPGFLITPPILIFSRL